MTSSGIGSSSRSTGLLQGSHCNALIITWTVAIITWAVVLVRCHRHLSDSEHL